MKRSDLTIGERYAGPGDRCYEIVDLSPGWRIDHLGQWVEDKTTNTRHMPGRGDVAYRSNLAVKAYLVLDTGLLGGERQRAVVDPRKLTGLWTARERVLTAHETRRVRANRILTLMRRNLRGYPGYKPAAMTEYQVSEDGLSATLPVEDLSVLMDVAFGDVREPGGSS
jgi:hypothetical protein